MRGERFFPAGVQKALQRSRLLPHCSIGLKKSLDLGCGAMPANPLGALETWGIDLQASDNPKVIVADLAVGPIPFEEESFDCVSAFDFLEHIPRVALGPSGTRFPFVDLMNEIHRVLRIGGYFYSFTPAYPSAAAFRDPTHVNFISAQTMQLYFSGHSWATMYGFRGNFHLVAQGWIKTHHYSLLRRVGGS